MTIEEYYNSLIVTIKADIGITDSSKDNVLLRKIKQAEAKIEGFLGLIIHSQNRTEIVSVFNDNFLVLGYPATMVTIYDYYGNSIIDETIIEMRESGAVYLANKINGVFKVEYTTGWLPGDIPEAVQEATIIQTEYDYKIFANNGDIYNTQQKGTTEVMKFAKYEDGLVNSVKAILREYKLR